MEENNYEKDNNLNSSKEVAKETQESLEVKNIQENTRNRVLSVIEKPFYAIKENLSKVRNFIKNKVINRAESIVIAGGEITSSGAKKVVEMGKQAANDITDIATLKLTDDPSEKDKTGPIPKIIRVPLPFGTAISIILGNIWKKIKSFFG